MPRPSSSVLTRSAAKFNKAMRKVNGFSLVELMVAIALSLLLLTGVVAIFASSRISYESTDQLSRVQETGRFALEHLSRQIRASGFTGCARQPNYVNTALASPTSVLQNFTGGPVAGYDATGTDWSPALDSTLVEGAFPESDVLVIRGPRLEAAPMRVTTSMAMPTDPLTVDSVAGVRDGGEIMMAYSCEAQSFFFATPSGSTLVHGVGGLNASNSTSFPFRENSEVVPVETVIYYVADAVDDDPPTLPANTRSLYRRAGGADPEELVQGVEQMQVEYGLDTTGDGVVDVYRNGSSVTDWQQVIAVRVALLVRSIQEYGTDRDERAYQLLADTNVAPIRDRRLREVFQATVSVRSRVRVD